MRNDVPDEARHDSDSGSVEPFAPGRPVVVIALPRENERVVIGHWCGTLHSNVVLCRSVRKLRRALDGCSPTHAIIGDGLTVACADLCREIAGRGIRTLCIVDDAGSDVQWLLLGLGAADVIARPLETSAFLERVHTFSGAACHCALAPRTRGAPRCRGSAESRSTSSSCAIDAVEAQSMTSP